MRFAALVSGKDSIYNTMKAVEDGHKLVCILHVRPTQTEMNSYMYQSIGTEFIPFVAACLQVPLFTVDNTKQALSLSLDYTPTESDEVECLCELINKARRTCHFEAISVGAIASNYQKRRVESVCTRLSLTPLLFMWMLDQTFLLNEIASSLKAVVVKVAGEGLSRTEVGRELGEIKETLLRAYNPCGEGGEYETVCVDCPLFKNKRISIVSAEIIEEKSVCYMTNCVLELVDKEGSSQ